MSSKGSTSRAEGDTAPADELSEESVARVVERIRRVRDEDKDGVVAFDADGTLWTGDVGVDVFEAILRENGVRDAALATLRAEASGIGAALSTDPTSQANVLYEAYRSGLYSEDRTYAMMAWVFAGFTLGELDQFAARVVRDAALKSRAIAESCAVLEACRTDGIDTYIVSASPRAAIVAGLALLGIEPAAVAAMTPIVADGVVGPRALEPWTYAQGKTLALSLVTNGRSVLAAFGDSAFDVAMLSCAKVRVAVRPKAELRARRHEVQGLVLLSES